MSLIAFYNGAAGMRAYQNNMNVISHNIANVNTNGYKSQRANFDDLIYSRIDTRVPGPHMVGHGVKQDRVQTVFGQSSFDQTNVMLDFAIEGDGFFMVEKNGETEYTRNGAFYLSVEGDQLLLTTADGAYVLDSQGNRIALEKNESGVNTENLANRIGLYSFPNLYGLENRNGARYAQTEVSGEAVLMGTGAATGRVGRVYQGSLERSGVDLVKEMSDVISAQRAFQLNSRMLQTADQLANEVNNLR